MSILHAPTYHWTVEEYEQLGQTEVFCGKPRVELLNGEIIVMSPIGYRHGLAIAGLTRSLIQQSADRYELRVQLPIILDELSEPEPDFALADPAYRSTGRHPRPEHLYLLIEVSDSTVRYDREDKRRAYARNKVQEFWLFNLQTNQLEAYRDPTGDQYRSARVIDAGGTVSPFAFPDVELRLADLIP